MSVFQKYASSAQARKVLIVHVPYEHRGGEDVHVDALAQGYREIGIEPVLFPASRVPSSTHLKAAFESLMPLESSPEIEAVFRQENPIYIHLHNAFPKLGPRFFRWVVKNKIKMAMTVHNHRFFCTNGLALRDKKICKDCFSDKVPWRAIRYNCNQDIKKTVYHALALSQMRLQELYPTAVYRFVAPSPYLQGELVRAGMPKERVMYILNPVFWSEEKGGSNKANKVVAHSEARFDAIYAGRLSQEKGIAEFLKAIELLPQSTFVVAGDGPERPMVEAAAKTNANIKFVGAVTHEEVLDLIAAARIAVLPSICNETLSTFALEAFYQGRRCVVPALDSTSWLASSEFPGVLAKAGDSMALAESIRTALALGPIPEDDILRLRLKLGFHRFCKELNDLVHEMMH